MSLIQCRCGQPLWALGIPDCHPVLRPIRRIAFETNLEPSPERTDFNLLASSVYTDARRLMTPLLYNVESERPEPVFEELSGTKFFVRHQPRTFKALVTKPPTEWGINIEQLRCVSRLGVFLIDDAGVVWARRVGAFKAAPIPIEPGTVQARLLFPSDATITKYEISFDFALDLMDFELVPVFAEKELLSYAPLIAARMDVQWDPVNDSLVVGIYALFARGAGDKVIPIPGLASFLQVRDAAGILIPTSFTEFQPGIYSATISPPPPASGNPYTVSIVGAVSDAFDYTTAVAQFNV